MKYECHGHIAADGADYRLAMARHEGGASEVAVRAELAKLREHGVTYFRDGGDRVGASALAKSLAPEYGIEYRTPIFITYKRGGYGGMYGRAFDDMRGYRALVREAAELGADFVKLTASGMLDFAGDGSVMGGEMPTDELREMVRAAHGEGFAVMTHVSGADNIKRAIDAGTDSVEHGFWADEAAIRAMSDAGTIWTPTCAPVTNLLGKSDDPRFCDATLRRIWDAHSAMLRYAYGLNVALASGSDSGAYGVPHGRGTDDEYAALATLGIDPARGNAAVRERFARR
ncbi:MAG: amidohydrolase family protein [Oscillospiraceae bacterium]|nr:amidohydrolase family protein [Oscillospiraceae bacterium]